METETQISLESYLKAFEHAKARVGDDQVAAVIVEQIGKDARAAMIRQERASSTGLLATNRDAPATPKQIGLLRHLGVPAAEARLTVQGRGFGQD